MHKWLPKVFPETEQLKIGVFIDQAVRLHGSEGLQSVLKNIAVRYDPNYKNNIKIAEKINKKEHLLDWALRLFQYQTIIAKVDINEHEACKKVFEIMAREVAEYDQHLSFRFDEASRLPQLSRMIMVEQLQPLLRFNIPFL